MSILFKKVSILFKKVSILFKKVPILFKKVPIFLNKRYQIVLIRYQSHLFGIIPQWDELHRCNSKSFCIQNSFYGASRVFACIAIRE